MGVGYRPLHRVLFGLMGGLLLLFSGLMGSVEAQTTPSAATSTVKVIPNVIPAGGTATVRVQLKDADGNDITTGGAVVDFGSPNSGTLGGVSDNGDGTYTATYTAPSVPDGQTGSITFVPSLGGTPFSNSALLTNGDIVKANNAEGMANGTSWVGGVAPTASDTGIIDATFNNTEGFGTGAPLSWLGMEVTGGTSTIDIRNGAVENWVGLGTGGLIMSSASSRTIYINSLQQQADHTWSVATGNDLFVGYSPISVAQGQSGRFEQANSSVLSLAGGGTISITDAIAAIRLGDTSAFTGSLNTNGIDLALVAETAESITFGGTLSGTTTISKSGDGTYELPGASFGSSVDVSAGMLVLSGTNTFSGNALTNAGAGTLLLSGSNSYTGTTEVSAGTLQVGNGGTAGSIGSGNITLRPDATLAFNRSDDVSLSNQWNGITGGGTQTLRNDGTGLVTIAGSGNIGANDTGEVFVLAGSGNGLIEQSLASAFADLAIRKEGSGTWTFTSTSNGYSGATTISAGTLQIGNGGSTGTIGTGDIQLDAGATLAFNRTVPLTVANDWISFTDGGIRTLRNDGTGKITLDGGNIGLSGGTTTLALVGSGNGEIAQSIAAGGAEISIAKEGAGTWTLSNTLTNYSGATTITAGTLEVTGLFGAGTYAKAIANDGELHINSTSAQTLSGVISGSGLLRKSAAGTLTLSGTNTYIGGTTLSGGTLALGTADAIGSTGTITLSGGTLQFSANNTTDYSARFATVDNQAFNFDTNGQDVTLATGLTSSSGGSLSKSGSGVLTLESASNYDGNTTILSGTLRLANSGSIGTGDISIPDGTLEFTGSTATNLSNQLFVQGTGSSPALLNNGSGLLTIQPGTSTNINVDNGETFTIGGSGDIVIEKSIASGAGASLLTKIGEGTVVLTSPLNNWSGGTTISDGVLQVGDGTSNGTIGSGTITLTNGRLAFNRVNPYTVSETFASFQDGTTPGIENNGAGLLTVNASNLGFTIGSNGITLELGGTGDGVVDGPIANGGAAANILKDGVGTWTFNDPETNYSGSTTINAGTLEITGRLGKGTYAQSIVNNADLKINTTSAQTLSGVISGTGELIKENTGTLTLSDTSTYDGNTTVSDGKLLISGALAGSNGTYAGDLVNNAEVEVNSATNQTYAGALSGNGDWIKDGSGTWTWDGANTSTGDLTVKGGSLRINENSSVPTGDIYVLNGALEFNRSSDTTFDSKFYIAGEGSAPTFLNNGTGLVTVAPGDVSNIGVDNGEPFTIGGSGDIRLEKSVASGANAALLTKVGTGTVTLVSSANNYSGGTTISEGVLQVGDGTNDGTIGSGLITITNGRIAFNRPNPYTVTESFATFAVGTTPGIENNGDGLLTVNAGNLSFNNGAELTFGGTGNGAVDGPIAIGNAAASIIKDGNGTWTFNGDNGYTGTTTVNAGTLLVNGDQSAATGTVTVANGATLGGSGTLGGLITLNTGSVLSPGTSPGILTAANGLTINAGNTFVWELVGNSDASNQRGTAYDGVDVTGGTLTIQDEANAELDFSVGVDFTDDFWQSQQQWLVFDNANVPSFGNGSIFDQITFSEDANGVALNSISGLEEAYFYWSQVGNDVYLHYVPLGNVSPSLSTITPASQTIVVSSGRATFAIQVKDSEGRNYPLASGLPTFDAPSQGTVGVSSQNGDGNYTIEYNAGSTVGTEVITPRIDGTLMSASFTATLVSADDVGSGSQVLDGTSGNTQVTDVFTTDGDLSLSQGFFVDYLIVGGGGSGAGDLGGGGGAGGLLQGTAVPVTNLNYNVIVGGGGVYSSGSGGDGGNSSWNSLTAVGGGGGGYRVAGRPGGSGGGAGGRSPNASGGAATSGQGKIGGTDVAGNDQRNTGGAGGGGAGAAGSNNTPNVSAGNGGAGIQSSITGQPEWYAAGGGGGGYNGVSSAGTGGSGIGGNGGLSALATDGAANTGSGGGGGGGGGGSVTGGNGGSGVVVLRYKGSTPNETIVSNVTPNTILNDTYQLYKFTTVGSNTFDLSNAVAQSSIVNSIGGSGNLTYSGVGKLILEANNTYSGTTTISGGILQIGNGDANGSFGSGAIINNANLIINRNNTYTLGGSNTISGSGTVEQIGSGTLDLGGITSHAAGSWILRNGSISNGTIAGDFTLESGSISAVLGGSGNLTKNTGGTVTLSGNNTYSGTTTVNTGTLIVNGANSGSGAVTVNTGATLKGSGSLSGTTTVNSGATVLAGNSIGMLGFTDLTLKGGGNLNWQIDDATGSARTNWDQLNVSGTLTINANSGDKFNINVWSLLSDGSNGELANFKPTESLYTWPIITAASISGFDADAFQINTNPINGTGGLNSPYKVDGFTIISDGTTISLQYDPPAAQTIDGTNDGTEASNYTTENTTGSLTLDLGFFADYLIVGGGGGGGDNLAGGGGAGGFLQGTGVQITNQIYPVVVGAGGAGAIAGSSPSASGANSSWNNITALGGGAGGSAGKAGTAGGSGGGAGARFNAANGGGSGSTGQGNAGGDDVNPGWTNAGGGGGGGAGAPGQNNASTSRGGDGGAGLASTITGQSIFYAGGGGGGFDIRNGNSGGLGGNGGGGMGGRNGAPTAGTANTGGGGGGGGGGGSTNPSGANGGSGVVVLRYAGDALSNVGGTVTTFTGNGTIGENGVTYQVHTFTSSANFDLSSVDFDARLKATLSGNIVGTGKLIYNSEGRLTLTGSAHTYTGQTIIENGELRVNSDLTNSSDVLVKATAILSGTGDLPPLDVYGKHRPGNSPGIQTIRGSAIYRSGSVIEWELNTNSGNSTLNHTLDHTLGAIRGVHFDGINVEGDLHFGQGSVFEIRFDDIEGDLDWKHPEWKEQNPSTRLFNVFELGSESDVYGLDDVDIRSANGWIDSKGQSFEAVHPGKTLDFEFLQIGNEIYLQMHINEKVSARPARPNEHQMGVMR